MTEAAQQLLSKTAEFDPEDVCGITIELQFRGDEDDTHPEPDDDQKGGPSDGDADNKDISRNTEKSKKEAK